MGAYLIPTITAYFWLYGDKIIFLVSISCILLEFKFLMFFRAYKQFGSYFIIMINVGRKIFSFLIVLLIILLSFSHAFWILLTPSQDYDLDVPIVNDDPNNPWSLTDIYNQVENGVIAPDTSLVQKPDMNTNMFTDYATSIFATYLFLTGITCFIC